VPLFSGERGLSLFADVLHVFSDSGSIADIECVRRRFTSSGIADANGARRP
jgi:hypothetical protein